MKTDMIFKSHPHLDECFTTADGQAFYTEASAKMHAKTLKNKAVKCVKKSAEMEKPETAEPVESVGRDALIARYTELFGKAPAKNAKNETIQQKISEKEAELTKIQSEDETED